MFLLNIKLQEKTKATPIGFSNLNNVSCCFICIFFHCYISLHASNFTDKIYTPFFFYFINYFLALAVFDIFLSPREFSQ